MGPRMSLVVVFAIGGMLSCTRPSPPDADADDFRDARIRAEAERARTAADRAHVEADRSHREADRANDARHAAEIARANAEPERARASSRMGDQDDTGTELPSSPSSRGQAIVSFASGDTHANLRGGPGRRYEKLAEVPRGSTVLLLGGTKPDEGRDAGSWYRVSFEGTSGWLHENSLVRK